MFCLGSCLSSKEYPEWKLFLEVKNVSRIECKCANEKVSLDQYEIIELIEKVNFAKKIGVYKAIVTRQLTIYQNDNDTINLRLFQKYFKWNRGGDWTFQLDLPNTFFDSICSRSNLRTKRKALHISNPISTIRRVFDDYNQHEESTDSRDNLDSLQSSLKVLENKEMNLEDLTLVVNVWMYYMVTDFSTLDYTESVLFKHREMSIIAIEERIKKKKKWESNDSAPYSDLLDLLEKLKKDI